ncbi:hypothetical protein ATCM_04830 [Stenotrophomonas sp. ATCM1_4]|uniref:DUF6587 family protein n=1 Tax=Stenotrophomonas sp. ATCM1_4 TaxID=2259330 RepID=UPI001045821F|nr:DUF6587 family protein [Stenotrophomonas sp. ATCM1_4]TDB27026.1 hypothetical protein ATCM_04830 [Stenotrophomonas sp. ATCM1_4]
MDRGMLLQYLIIALAVLVSAWVVLKKQFPGVMRRLRGALALWLVKPAHSQRLQEWGRRLAPPPANGGGACGGCSSCDTKAPKQH